MTDLDRIPPEVEPVLPALLAVTRDLNSEKDLNRLLEQTIPGAVCGLLDAERCTLFLLDDSRKEIWSRVATGTDRLIRLRVGDGIAGSVAATGEALQIDEPYSDNRFAREIDEATGFKTRNLLCVPLRDMAAKVLGVFEVLNKKEGTFTGRDRSLLEILGRQAAVAIEGARVNSALRSTQAQLREQIRRMAILHRIEKELNGAEELDQTLSTVIRLCAEALSADAGSILLAEGSTARLYFQYAWGEKSDDLRRMSMPQGLGIASWVLTHRRATMTNDPDRDPRHSPVVSRNLGYDIRNLVAAPLISGGRSLGALEVVNRREGAFDFEDLQLLDFLASQVSASLDRKLLLEKMQREMRLAAVGGMASRIVHDLKNSMAVIRGLAEMSDRPNVPAQKVHARKQLMLSAIDGLVAMTQDVLDYARGSVTCQYETVDLKTIAQAVMEMIEADCELHRVEASLRVPDDLELEADPLKLRRVLFNLAINALDVMPSGGKLEIAATANEDGGLQLEVCDTGPGIPTGVQDRLFSPFVTYGKANGAGLGLAICKSLVEAHGGRIEGRNRPGGGAAFSIWLPRVQRKPQEARAE